MREMRIELPIYLSLFFILFSCMQDKKSKLPNDVQYLEKINDEINSGKEIIQFEKIVKFEWESLIILTPYSWPEHVGDEYNIDLSSVEHFGIKSREDINLIVFLNKNKPVRAIAYPRYPGDFSNNPIEIIDKSKANFKIGMTEERTTDGKQWVRLIKL